MTGGLDWYKAYRTARTPCTWTPTCRRLAGMVLAKSEPDGRDRWWPARMVLQSRRAQPRSELLCSPKSQSRHAKWLRSLAPRHTTKAELPSRFVFALPSSNVVTVFIEGQFLRCRTLAAALSRSMALITAGAVVDVIAHISMFRIGLGLGMASCASKQRIVGWVGVTGGTHALRPTVIAREPGVVEGCSLPRTGGVTGLAGRREVRSCVVRIGRGLVVGLMTGVAIRRNRGVVVVHVTAGTGHGGVLASERERRIAVIE